MPSSSTSTGRPARGARAARSCCRCSATTTARCSRRASSVSKFDAGKRRYLLVTYYDHRFPIAVRHYAALLLPAAGPLGEEAEPLLSLDRQLHRLGGRRRRARRGAPSGTAKRSSSRPALAEMAADPQVRAALEAAVAALNGTPGLPPDLRCPRTCCSMTRPTGSPSGASPARRSTTAASSTSTSWPPCAWSAAKVFEATHRLLLRLIAEGKVQGIRLDHIDGMYDPRGYCSGCARSRAVLAEQPRRVAPNSTPRAGQRRSTSWSKNSRLARASARRPAGRRHHRLRFHDHCERPVRRPRGRTLADRHLRSVHRPRARLRPRSSLDAKLTDPALFPGQRAARARASVPPPGAADLVDPRLHAPACTKRSPKSSSRFPVYRTYVTAAGAQDRRSPLPGLGDRAGAQGLRPDRPLRL